MDKEKARQHLYNQVFLPALAEQVSALAHFFERNQERLVAEIIESFRDICIRIAAMQQFQEKAAIGFIHYSMLRTSVLERAHTYLIEAYSDQWYWDREACYARYDAGWALQGASNLIERLEERRPKYMGILHPADVEYMVLQHLDCFTQFVTALMRLAMPQAVRLPEYQNIKKANRLRIRIGELMDISEDVHVEDCVRKKEKEAKRLLSEQGSACAYESFAGIRLSSIVVKEMDLRYSNFSESDLTATAFHSCVLIGTNWNGSVLHRADFSNSLLHDADFRGCDLRGAIFTRVNGQQQEEGFHRLPGLLGVRFTNADLEGAVFTDARLYGADFRGANLRNAVFLQKDRERYRLSPEQIAAISWIDGSRED
ncbi:pentapeptide repeat-containing protein [Paenibacillus dendritiformis]|uniref:pentapeptide repeat-containing protein n=1 Tax=Paenibacillus dendritiformis TaxID=130049 RepID=UPI00365934B0